MPKLAVNGTNGRLGRRKEHFRSQESGIRLTAIPSFRRNEEMRLFRSSPAEFGLQAWFPTQVKMLRTFAVFPPETSVHGYVGGIGVPIHLSEVHFRGLESFKIASGSSDRYADGVASVRCLTKTRRANASGVIRRKRAERGSRDDERVNEREPISRAPSWPTGGGEGSLRPRRPRCLVGDFLREDSRWLQCSLLASLSISSYLSLSLSLVGVGAFGFGDRGVNSDEPRLRRARRRRRRGEGGAGGRDEDQQEERKTKKRTRSRRPKKRLGRLRGGSRGGKPCVGV